MKLRALQQIPQYNCNKSFDKNNNAKAEKHLLRIITLHVAANYNYSDSANDDLQKPL